MEAKVTHVVKRDGRVVEFDVKRIENAVRKAMLAVNKYDPKALKRVVNTVLKILNEKYGDGGTPHVEEIQDIVEFSLVKHNLYEVAKAYILYRRERERIRKEKMLLLNKDKLDEVDKSLSLNAIRLLASRYLLKDEEGRVIESPKQLFQRVAMAIVIADILYDPEIYDREGGQKPHPDEEFTPEAYENRFGFTLDNGETVFWNRWHLERMKALYDRLNKQGKMRISWSQLLEKLRNNWHQKHLSNYLKYYNLMVSKKFIPNSPTLFNAGTRLGQLSACFVLDMEDDLESIMDAAKDAAMIFKSGGGVGINYSKLRPEGDIVSSTSGVASGPVSFMRIIDTVTDVIKQGGCIACDTYIRTDKGLIPAKEMIEDRVLREMPLRFSVYDGDGYSNALLSVDNGGMEVLRVLTDIGIELKATYNHMVAVLQPDGQITWKQFIHLREGDYIVLVLGGHRGIEIRLPSITPSHHNSNPIKVPEKMTPELAELLGIYMADGTINRGRFIFSSSKQDNEYIERIKYLMKKLFNLHVGSIRDRGSYVDLVFYSKDLEKYFNLNKWVKNTSSEAFVPMHVMMSPPEVVKAFIRGVFSGDGDVHSDGYPRLYTTSERLAREIQQLLLGLGIVSRLTVNKNRDGSWGEKPIYILSIITEDSIKKFKEEIGFIQSKKNEKVRAIPKKTEPSHVIPIPEYLKRFYNYVGKGSGPGRGSRGADKELYRDIHKYMLGHRNLTLKRLRELMEKYEDLRNDSLLRELATGKYYFARVVSIEKAKAKTMEIEVVESGKYTANGVLVHNKRRGANMGILEVWHPDIEKFITAKEKEGVLENFNISVMVNDEFMRKVDEDGEYELINPRNGEKVRRVRARKLFRMIAEYAWKTGDPGLLFLDRINQYNVMKDGLGLIRSTNPCSEEPLYPYESCNLGSLNLYAFLKFDEEGNAEFDWEEFRQAIQDAYEFLDNVIDVNKYPIKAIEETTNNLRRVGLGLMGLADTLSALGIPYNSEEGFEFTRKITEYITYYAMKKSVERAKTRGVFPLYSKSKYPEGMMPVAGYYRRELWTLDWEELRKEIMQYGLRNVGVSTIAPTGSISMIVDVSSGVEPIFALVYEKHVSVGVFFYTDIEFERQLKLHGLYNEEILKKIADNGGSLQGLDEIPDELKKNFPVAYDIPWWDHIRMQYEAGLWITESISKTINMPNWVSVEDVEKAYLFSYRLGVKGITIYRDGSKSVQVLITPSQKKGRYFTIVENKTLEMLEKLGLERPKMEIASEAEEKLAKATSAILGDGGLVETTVKKDVETCPECGSTALINTEGCLKCLDCGWTACVVA